MDRTKLLARRHAVVLGLCIAVVVVHGVAFLLGSDAFAQVGTLLSVVCCALAIAHAILQRRNAAFSIGFAAAWLLTLTTWVSYDFEVYRFMEPPDPKVQLTQAETMDLNRRAAVRYEIADSGLRLVFSAAVGGLVAWLARRQSGAHHATSAT